MRKILTKLNIYNKDDFWLFVWQFFKFGVVGLSNTAISLGIYYIFLAINPALYMWGNVIGWVVSVANGFFWGNKVVFKSKNSSWKDFLGRLGKSYLSYGLTFIIGTLLLFLEVKCWGLSEWLAPIINLIITIPLNFLLNKFWTFK